MFNLFKDFFDKVRNASAEREKEPPSPLDLLYRQVQGATEADLARSAEQMSRMLEDSQMGLRRRVRGMQGLGSNG